jgi:hypothetical protein
MKTDIKNTEGAAGADSSPLASSDFVIRTWQAASAIRWRKPHPNEYRALIESTHGKYAPVLQQAWQCVETGEIDWRDVPMVDYPNAESIHHH